MSINNFKIEPKISTLDSNNIHNEQRIHYLFIFNRAGICLYGRNFTNQYKMNDQLVSAFCSALITFSMEMVGNNLKKIDFHPVEIVLLQKKGLYYGILIDHKQNMNLLKDYIELIDKKLRDYILENDVNIEVENIHDHLIDEFIDNLIMENDASYDKEKEKILIEFLKSVITKSDIEGIVLFTNRGKIIYSSINSDNLKTLLDKLDFRIKVSSDNNSIVNLFYSTKKELIFSTPINQSYFIGAVFGIDTPLGIAEYKLKKIIKQILKILEG
ncbi:MAG: hypothetical protein EU541_01610 [Promethearchaeota archaeon]|nr:MAG: hypothetical protein EU541_01610 [Candidatus Lokiarchaeota archaeon]